MHTCIYAYTSIHPSIHPCMRTCAHAFMQMCNTCIHACKRCHTCMHACMHACMNMHACIHTFFQHTTMHSGSFSMRRSTKLGSHNDTRLCTLDRIDAGGLHVLCKTILDTERESQCLQCFVKGGTRQLSYGELPTRSHSPLI